MIEIKKSIIECTYTVYDRTMRASRRMNHVIPPYSRLHIALPFQQTDTEGNERVVCVVRIRRRRAAVARVMHATRDRVMESAALRGR